jgi:hypothetical protein
VSSGFRAPGKWPAPRRSNTPAHRRSVGPTS